jgi:branched-chain amino acid aminotransferase
MSIQIIKSNTTCFNNIDWSNLRFGVYFSDHMFVSNYENGKWDDGKIIPYGDLRVQAANCTLHYGQAIFEGLKAFSSVKGGVNLFRPDMNAKRLASSSRHLCIPPYNEDKLVDAMIELVKVDSRFIPQKRGESLYLRPFVFGTGNFLGVTASKEYKLVIITSPVASYYAEGLSPVKIMVENEHVRAVRGGLGSAKTAANYAASMLAAHKAHEKGYSQVLWLDGITRKYIDEVGAMNIMVIIGDELITPTLERGAILPGVTRNSVLTLAREWGMKVSEREISIDEIYEAYKNGNLKEMFGTGTAAVISPVGLLHYNGHDMIINDMRIGETTKKFYDYITSIQYGEIEDTRDWIVHIKMKEQVSV